MIKKRKVKEAPSGADYGTKELSRHFRIVPKLTDPSTMAGRVMDGDEVDRLLLIDAIDTMQHATLRTLQKRLHGFGFVGMRSPDYSSPIHADATAVGDKKAETIRGAVHLFERLDKHPHIGMHRRKKVVNLVIQDAPWGDKRHQYEELHHVIRALDDIFISRK